MFTSAAILLSFVGAERSGRGGGGTPDIIHAYVRWGCHWTSKCKMHLPHIFTGAFAILRYKDLDYTQTIYLATAGSTHYSISYLNRRL